MHVGTYIHTCIIVDSEEGTSEMCSGVVPRGMIQMWLDQDAWPHVMIEKEQFIRLLEQKPVIMANTEKYTK